MHRCDVVATGVLGHSVVSAAEYREVVVLEDGATDAGEMPIVVESLGSVDRNLYLRGDGQGLLLAGIHFEGVSDEEAADPDRSPGLAAVVAEELSRGHSDLLPDLAQCRLERFSVANTE